LKKNSRSCRINDENGKSLRLVNLTIFIIFTNNHNNMFRHKQTATDETVKSSSSQEEVGGVAEVGGNKVPTTEAVKADPSLKELIEKNLKWSQIIYEQNRKINNKLLWAGIFSWFKIILIVAPLIWAYIYLQPMLKGVLKQYGSLLGLEQQANTKPASVDSLLNMLNLDPAKQEQLKALLK